MHGELETIIALPHIGLTIRSFGKVHQPFKLYAHDCAIAFSNLVANWHLEKPCLFFHCPDTNLLYISYRLCQAVDEDWKHGVDG